MKTLQTIVTTSLLTYAAASSAVVVDFNSEMDLRGDAYIHQHHVPNGVVLTENKNWENGSAFTTASFANISSFTASFQFKMGGGGNNGADGLTFAWVSNPSASTNSGGSMGYDGLTGYSVEFDTYRNSWDLGSDNHVAVNGDRVGNSLTQSEVNFNLNDFSYHNAEITFENGIISVAIDGHSYIDNYEIANYQAFDGHFGFTASTGGQHDWHKVKDFDLTVTAVPEPSVYALMIGGLGLVGFMAARRKKA